MFEPGAYSLGARLLNLGYKVRQRTHLAPGCPWPWHVAVQV